MIAIVFGCDSMHILAIECVKRFNPLLDVDYVPLRDYKSAPEESGLYLAASEKLLCIGKSKCLRGRLRNHCHTNWRLKQVEQARIGWISIRNLSFLDSLESYLINFWTPPFNGILYSKAWENDSVSLERSRTFEQPMDAEIDLIPVKDLWTQYGVGKTTFYMRALSDLRIVPVQFRGRSHITSEAKALLDRYYNLTEEKRQTWVDEQFGRREPLPYIEPVPQTERSMPYSPLPVKAKVRGKVEVKVQDIQEIAQAIAQIIRPTDRFSHYEQLERFAQNSWLISSKDLRDLIGRTSLRDGMKWGGFRLKRSGRWWRVSKE